MRKLKNTLYVLNELMYLSRERKNIVLKADNKVIGRFPIHILENIVCFNYNGVSPAIIELCNSENVDIAFITPQGKYQGRFVGATNGNVLLRRQQYRIADLEEESLRYAKNMIIAKTSNYRQVLRNLKRDHSAKIDNELIERTMKELKLDLEIIEKVNNLESLRGIEGDSARTYFQVFNEMILQQKEDFTYKTRSRRPPLDRINALLSFTYTILTNEIQGALEVVGLDSYVGFYHVDRPGRRSLALDMIEELRAYLADRFVIKLINNRQITANHFIIKENGAVLLTEDGMKEFFTAWQARKQEVIKHPFIEETHEIGLLPYVQASLLARTIRGDLAEYPPFVL